MRPWISLIIILLFTSIASQAQGACPAIVQTALESTDAACSALGRNEACYGHIELNATGRTDDFTFNKSGDIVDVNAIDTLTLQAMDESSDSWGIAMMSLQANIPNSMPGQNVTFLLFGDVEVENATPEFWELPVYANGNTRLRSSPSTETDFNILVGVPAGTELNATGRIESGEWLRVTTTINTYEHEGWITALAVDGDSERMSLPVVEVGDLVYGPMQAFYLRTGIGATDCAEAPPDGVLIQTPEGVGSVDFLVNGVKVNLGSTAFIQLEENTLSVAVVEGKGIVSASGGRQFVPPGTRTTVELADDGQTPVDVPTYPEAYDYDRLSKLPVDVASPVTLVPETITVADAVPEAEVDAAIAVAFEVNSMGLIPGEYAISVISFQQVTANPLTDGYCASGGTVLQSTLTENLANESTWDIRVTSMSSFTFTNTIPPENGGCIVEHHAVWVSP